MSSDDLRAEISAVEDEMAGPSRSGISKSSRRHFPWVWITLALVIFILTDWFLDDSSADMDADLNHMMQQARHEVLDYLHHNGSLPDKIINPALRPYIRISVLKDNRFVLSGELGHVKQTLVEQ